MNDIQASSTASRDLSRRNFAAMAGVLLSRTSGIARTIVVNAMLGANTALDAFNTAFRFPNSLRDLFADGALSSAFMRVLVDAYAKGSNAERELVGIVTGFFILVTGGLAAIAAAFAPEFIRLMGNPQFEASGGAHLASQLFQVLIFYLPLTMLNAVMMAMLGVRGNTFRAMNGSIFLSVGMILGAVAGPLFSHYHMNAVWGITWGALLGAFMQLIYQSSPLIRLGLIPFPNFNPKAWLHYKPLREILWLMAPRTIGQGATTLALMVNTFFALQISTGAMTYVATTIIIVQVPIGLFGVATGFAALPVLTEALQKGNTQRFSQLLTESLDTTTWLSLFTTIGFSLLILPFYTVLFQHGAITPHDTLLNSLTVCAYATGIFFGAGSKVLLNTLYSLNAVRFIIVNSFAYLILNTLFSALLTPAYGLVGLGLAFGLASAGNFWLNYFFVGHIFRKKYGHTPYRVGNRTYTFLYWLASFAAILIGLGGCWFIQDVLTNLTWVFNFWHSFTVLVIGGLILITLFFISVLFFAPAPLQRIAKKLLLK
jgi:putative peptidoglycan lipid II flippase